MQQYLNSLWKIRTKGVFRPDRTGTGTVSCFSEQLRFDLANGFPLMTTKKLPFDKIAHELLWFLQGGTNIRYLVEHDVHFWDEWPYKHYLQAEGKTVPATDSDEWKSGMKAFVERVKSDDTFAGTYGELGPVYGHQWRHWPDGNGGEIDQIQLAVDTIKTNSSSRRIIVSAWNVADIEEMAVAGLPPCHLMFQFYVADGKLSCHLTQRSADMFLGVPFNIASYALLTMMMAQVTGLEVGELVMTLVDAHIYKNHFDQVEEQLSRSPRALPTVRLNPEVKGIFDFTIDDITLEGYDPDKIIRAPVAV